MAKLDTSITQKYLRRWPESKRARSWSGSLVHIRTEHGVWRVDAMGYTDAGQPDAWVLPFEEAQLQVAHCGPEKRAAFIRVLPPDGPSASIVEAARDLIASRSSTFRAGNNRQVGIEDESGEKMWIVPFDQMAALERAVEAVDAKG